MSVISDLIFHNAKHRLSSGYGPRKTISTAAGNTSSFHSGADYATYGEKLPQYAIEDGEVLTATKAADGALYVWVAYPRLGLKFLHYHLDSIKVKKGQKVTKNTILGYTGKTGKATGIHLHLGIKKISGGDYIDPEKWAKNEYVAPPKKTATKKEPAKKTETKKVKVEAAQKKDKALAGKYKVTASALHIRTGAGVNKTSLGTLKKGTIVSNYGYYDIASNKAKWLYVQTEDGTVGFCSASHLKKV